MTPRPLSTAELAALVAAVGAGLESGVDDAERIERVRLFERLKAAAAAGQVAEGTAFAASRRAAAARAGVPSARRDRGIASQLALAMRCSPWAARRFMHTAEVLVRDLPGVLGVLRAGRTTERRAHALARETIFLSRPDRAVVDAQLAPVLEGLGDRRVHAETQRVAFGLDPAGFVDRVRAAESDRRVTLRPAPDAMCRLTALLPLGPGVSTFATLCRDADAMIGAGHARSRGQAMADLLMSRLAGLDVAQGPPVEVELVMTDRALLSTVPSGITSQSDTSARDASGLDEPAEVIGYGPVPAVVARALALGPDTADAAAPDAGDAPRWLRRLVLDPVTGQLATVDSRRRCFTAAQRRFLRLRDRVCRTPWCEAPVRHADHVVPVARGGVTSVANGQSLCAACNYARQADGWVSHVDADGTITTTVPTGQRYRSPLPRPPGGAGRDPHSPINRRAG